MDAQKNNFANLPVIIFCVIIISVISGSWIRENYRKTTFADSFVSNDKDAYKWMEAVRGNNQIKAILYATRICGGCDMKTLPDPDYIKVVSDLKISTLILNAPFGKYDFLRWNDAFCIKKFVEDKTNGKTDEIESMFSAISHDIEYRKTQEGSSQALTLAEIIGRGYGNTHEKIRLLSECAFQAGYDVQTISLFDDSKNLIHVICEIRGKGKSVVADARFGKLWKNTTFAKFAENPEGVSEIWPENLVKSMKNHVYGVPSEFQDYKIYNQTLAANLRGAGIKDVPFFGADPRKRIEKYLKYFTSNENIIITYWRYPFFALLSQPDFPADWKLNYEKLFEK